MHLGWHILYRNLLSPARLSRRTPGTYCTTTPAGMTVYSVYHKCTVDLTTLSTNSLNLFILNYYYFLFLRPLSSISPFNRQWPLSSPCWLELRPCDQGRTSHTIPLPFRHCSPVLEGWSRRVLLVFLFLWESVKFSVYLSILFVALTSQFLWGLDLIVKSKLRAKKTDFY